MKERERTLVAAARYGAITSLESARRFLDHITRAAGPEGVEGQQEALDAIRVAIDALAPWGRR